MPSRERRRRVVVVIALAANVTVGLLKLAAGLISGSSALMSEAAHSAGDTTTELFLLVAQRRSRRPADRRHPFGYGKERYYWSLLAAGAIFVSGALFSVYEGVTTILHPGSSDELWLNYPVLAVAAVVEGSSFLVAAREVREHTRRQRLSLRQYLRDPDDPTVNSVALEDSAALVGITIAASGVALHQLTGSAVWDGVASLMIGLLLLSVAVLLARACEALLIGKQAPPGLLRSVEAALEAHDEIVDVVDLLSMLTGTGRVLLCVRADFVDDLPGGDIERACVRVSGALAEQFEELDEIFIQPTSRQDEGVRERVRSRYGAPLADDP